VAGAEAYLRAKFHLDPSNSLATVHQRYRQIGQADRQQSDSIGGPFYQRSPKNSLLMLFVVLNVSSRSVIKLMGDE